MSALQSARAATAGRSLALALCSWILFQESSAPGKDLWLAIGVFWLLDSILHVYGVFRREAR
jgi:hypothetical protein